MRKITNNNNLNLLKRYTIGCRDIIKNFHLCCSKGSFIITVINPTTVTSYKICGHNSISTSHKHRSTKPCHKMTRYGRGVYCKYYNITSSQYYHCKHANNTVLVIKVVWRYQTCSSSTKDNLTLN